LVEKGGESHRSDASARKDPGRLCNLVADRECPLLVGNYLRKERRRMIELERFSRGI
jgi:hypothetical protein